MRIQHGKDISLFILIAFISGAGWIFVPSQVSEVPALFSISYRFLLSSLLILGIALIRKEKIFDKSVMGLIIFQGMLMYPLNYYLTYTACKYTPSGLVGLISSFIIVPSYVLGVFLKKYPFRVSTVLAIGVSLVGLCLLFRKEVSGYTHHSLGLILALLSDLALATALLIIPALKKKTSVGLLGITGQSMFMGGILSFLLAFLHDPLIPFVFGKTYLLGLLVLSVLTPLVFVSFYYFSSKKGSVFASYIWVIAPIFSVLMSFLVKEYHPGPWDGIGIFLILSSCLYVNRSLTSPVSHEGS